MTFFSFTLFKNNYIQSYNRYFPIYNGFRLTMNGMGQMANIDKTPAQLFKFMDYLDKNKAIKNYRLYINGTSYNQDYFNMDYSKYYSKYELPTGDIPKSIPSIKMDVTYYSIIKKYVTGPGFKASDFHKNKDYTPIIMGENFSKDYKIGQVLISRDEKVKFKVVGFLKENVIVLSDADPVYNSQSLEGSFILPLDRTELLGDASIAYNLLAHFSIEFNPKKISYKVASYQIEKEMNSIGLNFSTSNFYDDFNGF